MINHSGTSQGTGEQYPPRRKKIGRNQNFLGTDIELVEKKKLPDLERSRLVSKNN